MDTKELGRQFEQFLRQKGYKVTKGRVDLIEKIANYGTHFEIEQLVMWITSSDRGTASRSTIYRTIRLLQEFGAIREVIKLGNRTIYEFIAGKPHHEHLVCVKCGSIVEFYKEEIEKLQDVVCEEHKFTPITHRLEIFGVCSKCKEKGL
ncbi:MAG: Fur family transcriptional regulator [Aquificaceae bacterium]